MRSWQTPCLSDLEVQFTEKDPKSPCEQLTPSGICHKRDCPWHIPKNNGKKPGKSGYCGRIGTS